MSRETAALRAGLLARGDLLKGDRYPLENLEAKLASLLPTKTEAELACLVAALMSKVQPAPPQYL